MPSPSVADDLGPLIEAQLRGAVVRYADLIRFKFKSGERRLFGGFGKLLDCQGEEWTGIGDVGRMSAVSAGPGQAIEELTLSLFGSVEMLAHIEEDTEETIGREVFRYLQFFDIRKFNEAGNWVDWAPLPPRLTIFWGRMGAPFVDRPKVEPGSSTNVSRIVSVRAVNAFINRRKPAYGFFSHRDQQARAPGDNIFVNASRMADATTTWPSGLS